MGDSTGAHGAAVGRWGLLVTAIALVAALVGTSTASYLEIGNSSVPLLRTLARDLVASARRTIHGAGALRPEGLTEALEQLQDDGVRYVAVVAEDGTPMGAAGAALMGWDRKPERATAQDPVVEVKADGSRARAIGPFMGRGGGRGWRMRTGATPEAALPWRGAERAWLVLEFEPRVLGALRSRATATLAVAGCTGLLLLAAAVVFWRVSLRAERTTAQLERDRQLKHLGQMSAVLGHELRNPLAGLKGHAQLILRKLPAEHAARIDAETVVREAVRLELLAEQVLEFARTGEVHLDAEDPTLIARDAAEAVGSDRVRMESCPAAPPRWLLDRPRMEQVLTNLLRNGIQASPDGGTVEFATFVDRDRRLVFEVRDRGEGLAPGEEESIFQPFVTHRAKGSGLGLTLARQIIEGHGGRIEAIRRPGGGTTFRVTIPERRA